MMNPELIALLDSMTPKEGINLTPVEEVILYRTETRIKDSMFMYNPCVVFVAQGSKTGYIADKQIRYDPDHMLVTPAWVPFRCDAVGAPGKPFLAVSIPLSHTLLADLIRKLEPRVLQEPDDPLALYTEPVTAELADAFLRLLRCLSTGNALRALPPLLIQEIAIHVLQGESAGVLFNLFSRKKGHVRILRSLQVIHEEYSGKLDIPSLAALEGMSVSSFHSLFKQATDQTPLQYIKRIRLHRARDLIVFEGNSSTESAYAVGYESFPQFSREFKRYFGYTPKESPQLYPVPS